MERVQGLGIRFPKVSKKVCAILVVVFAWISTGYACPCVVEKANKEVGVREVGGNNRGKRVAEYLLNAGITTPAPWCAAFVKFILDACNIEHKVTAWSPSATAINRIYDRRKPLSNTITPKSGDVFTLYYPNLNRIGHTGFVESWGDKWVDTIEGNTNDGGSRDSNTGDSVMKRKRLQSSIYQVSRYNKHIGNECNVKDRAVLPAKSSRPVLGSGLYSRARRQDKLQFNY